MELLYLSLLLFVLGGCHGQTQFVYKTQDDLKLKCETKKWKISTKSDLVIDCSVQCEEIRIILDDDDDELDSCIKSDPQPKQQCSLRVKSGYFSCVKSLDQRVSIFPFKSSPNILHSYIVAIPNPHMTSSSENRSSVTVSKGESVMLSCSFTLTEQYKGKSFTVYWIKTVGESSTCLYSYDYYENKPPRYGQHCSMDDKLNYRISHTNKDPFTHNMEIRSVMELDSGRYLCALQMDTCTKGKCGKGNWNVIENITVSVNEAKKPQTTNPSVTAMNEEKTKNKSAGDPLMPLYTSWPICVGLLLSVWIVFSFTSKNPKTSRESEDIHLQSRRHGEERTDEDGSLNVNFEKES